MILFLDGLAVFFLLVLAIIGYQRGLVLETGRLAGLVIATLVAGHYFGPLAVKLGNWLPWAHRWLELSGFILLFLAINIGFRLVTYLARKVEFARRIGIADRISGFVLGLLKGVFILMMVVVLIQNAPQKSWLQPVRQQSRLFDKLDFCRRILLPSFADNPPADSPPAAVNSSTPPDKNADKEAVQN